MAAPAVYRQGTDGDRHPQRGEVAVFDSPADGTRLIKRVAAVAGDHVQLHEGHLSINGQPLQTADLQDVEASASAEPASIWVWGRS